VTTLYRLLSIINCGHPEETAMASLTEQQFDAAMMNIYHRARKEVGYNATRYLQMLHDQGGLRTAQTLLHASQVSDGYTALWERGRLDLTVEALVLQPEWQELFTEQELNIARQRLQQYGYQVGAASS
jgi:hypothetical protein